MVTREAGPQLLKPGHCSQSPEQTVQAARPPREPGARTGREEGEEREEGRRTTWGWRRRASWTARRWARSCGSRGRPSARCCSIAAPSWPSVAATCAPHGRCPGTRCCGAARAARPPPPSPACCPTARCGRAWPAGSWRGPWCWMKAAPRWPSSRPTVQPTLCSPRSCTRPAPGPPLCTSCQVSAGRPAFPALGCRVPEPRRALPANRVLIQLAGGFDGFQACCPDLCSESPALPMLPENSRPDPRAPLYDQGGPVEILPYLFLGSCSHSSDLQGLQACGITAVLNVSASCPNHFEGLLRYKSIPVEDNQMVEISAWFQEAIGFIDSVKNSGGRVLVHCQAGISRSATICLAYLIQNRRVRLDEAFDFVKQRRGVISPNFSFMGQLLQFETQVLCH
uniref:Dual specificity phosphatase 2 n=1 Tax=Sus scrofa TaxID=9823 RepID=A0A8D1TVU0_PIG